MATWKTGDGSMKLLEERIRKDGVVKPGNVLKVDSFLNHQMDVIFFNEMAKEFKRHRHCHHGGTSSGGAGGLCEEVAFQQYLGSGLSYGHSFLYA